MGHAGPLVLSGRKRSWCPRASGRDRPGGPARADGPAGIVLARVLLTRPAVLG
ncbi:hypothetical protein TVNIR_3752 [Thioalkalivibrio nitratireducens DSM 14787]|uniref:Uncharacterized protein n=1 Tax=Thioalkalivibrio nitratireducens (strain DSM 14787 / UNIQEM 213 / ALEN2) TaxID=1255043 RepID=L0E279_THIND|nr:hypothetical protein TVNIR_3752 [Thioalkalivibrio nitratireducens DSM 14787]